MPLLDIRTIIIICALSAVVSSVGLFTVASIYRSQSKAILFWIAANVLEVLGCLFYALRGTIPDLLSIVVANTAIVVSVVFYYQALATFYGKPVSLRLPLTMAGSACLGFACFTYVVPNLHARVVLGSSYVFALTAMCGVLLRSQKSEPRPRITQSMALGYLVVGVLWAMRAIAEVVVPVSAPQAAATSLLLGIAYTTTLIVAMFQTLGFVLLINDRANAELQRMASTDELTEVFNRRAIEAMAIHFVAHARRARVPCAVVMIDADGFKGINDTYGHAVGDQVLQQLVGTIVHSIRQQDVAGRFGGEEFIVLLPGTPEKEAERVANRICSAIAGTPMEIDGHRLSMTISAGVAALIPEEDDASSMIQRADRALYVAKAQGRNRVMLAESGVSS